MAEKILTEHEIESIKQTINDKQPDKCYLCPYNYNYVCRTENCIRDTKEWNDFQMQS